MEYCFRDTFYLYYLLKRGHFLNHDNDNESTLYLYLCTGLSHILYVPFVTTVKPRYNEILDITNKILCQKSNTTNDSLIP